MFNPPSRIALCLLLLSAALAGQAAQDRPLFKSGIRQIEVDVLVTDKNGKAVRGLTKDDFLLIEDDVRQPITHFSFADLPIESPASRAAAVKQVEPDVTTNTGQGRMYVMLISGEGHKTRLVARRFVEEAVGPNDQMAVIHVKGTMSSAQGFTRSRSMLLSAIDRIDHDDTGICDMACEFGVLEQVCERLALVTGRRKIVLWFDPPSLFHPGTDGRAIAAYFAQRDALRAASRNNVAVYPVSTAGLTTALGNLEIKAGWRVLSDETGGEAIIETNNFTPEYQRLVRDVSTYYLLAYEPAVDYRDGKFHKLTVRVKNRPELTVRARNGYYAPEPDAKAKPTPPVIDGLSVDAADAVRMPISVGGLGIDLVAVPFKGAGGKGTVLLGAQLRGPDLALGAGQRIEIAYQGTNTEGMVTPGAFKVFTFEFTPESRTTIERTGIRVVDRLELPKGRHQVRFAVHQPNGKTGSVVADVEIPDYSAPLVMSGVAIGSQLRATDRTLQSDPPLKAILASDPTAVRRFGRRDVISAFTEVYTDPSRPAPVRLTARVTPVKGGRTFTPATTPLVGEAGRAGYLMRLRLADLSPGDYVLTVEATSSLQRTAMRQVPFSVVAE